MKWSWRLMVGWIITLVLSGEKKVSAAADFIIFVLSDYSHVCVCQMNVCYRRSGCESRALSKQQLYLTRDNMCVTIGGGSVKVNVIWNQSSDGGSRRLLGRDVFLCIYFVKLWWIFSVLVYQKFLHPDVARIRLFDLIRFSHTGYKINFLTYLPMRGKAWNCTGQICFHCPLSCFIVSKGLALTPFISVCTPLEIMLSDRLNFPFRLS